MVLSSYMQSEAEEAAAVTEYQNVQYQKILPTIVQAIKKFLPDFIVTVGRGSSDHAASFAKYVFETQLGLVTASAAPSIETIYHATLLLKRALVVAFSQSGQSSDLCEVMRAANKAGALTIAFVNKIESPLTTLAHHVIPLFAGEELSVAATKTFIATLTAILSFTAYWKSDEFLLKQLSFLPKYFAQRSSMTPERKKLYLNIAQDLALRHDILVLGRGFTFPIASEAALKLKETCKLHAEAFSSAEVLHGPIALMQKDFPLLVFVPNDQAIENLPSLLDRLHRHAACVYLLVSENHVERFSRYTDRCHILPLSPSLHPLCDPLVAIQFFYLLAEECARLRGIDPDKPEHLSKVTDTR